MRGLWLPRPGRGMLCRQWCGRCGLVGLDARQQPLAALRHSTNQRQALPVAHSAGIAQGFEPLWAAAPLRGLVRSAVAAGLSRVSHLGALPSGALRAVCE